MCQNKKEYKCNIENNNIENNNIENNNIQNNNNINKFNIKRKFTYTFYQNLSTSACNLFRILVNLELFQNKNF